MEHDAAYLRFSFPKPSENITLEEFAHSISSVYRRGKLNYVTYSEILIRTSGNKQYDKDFISILENVDPIASSLVKFVTSFN